MGWLRKRLNLLLIWCSKIIGKEILVLGDSHAHIFNDYKVRVTMPQWFFNVVSVGGATISGLENPTSKTQAYPKFIDGVVNSKAKTAIVLLGEVDTGYVIWFRAEKYHESVATMFEQTIKNYQSFLIEISQSKRVICISSPLPTIKDGSTLGEVAKARMCVTATQKERTELTIKFNSSIKQFCNENGIAYMDLDAISLGENGIVCDGLLNSNPFDHHYDKAAYRRLLIPRLKALLID